MGVFYRERRFSYRSVVTSKRDSSTHLPAIRRRLRDEWEEKNRQTPLGVTVWLQRRKASVDGEIMPSVVAGHSMLCPYKFKNKCAGSSILAPWLKSHDLDGCFRRAEGSALPPTCPYNCKG